VGFLVIVRNPTNSLRQTDDYEQQRQEKQHERSDQPALESLGWR
jgi:hypothetical protein